MNLQQHPSRQNILLAQVFIAVGKVAVAVAYFYRYAVNTTTPALLVSPANSISWNFIEFYDKLLFLLWGDFRGLFVRHRTMGHEKAKPRINAQSSELASIYNSDILII